MSCPMGLVPRAREVLVRGHKAEAGRRGASRAQGVKAWCEITLPPLAFLGRAAFASWQFAFAWGSV